MIQQRFLWIVLLVSGVAVASDKTVGVLRVVDVTHDFSAEKCLAGGGRTFNKSSGLFGNSAQANWRCEMPAVTNDQQEVLDASKILPKKDSGNDVVIAEPAGPGKLLCHGYSYFKDGQFIASVGLNYDGPGVKDYEDIAYLRREVGEPAFNEQVDKLLDRCARQYFPAVEKDAAMRTERRLVIDKS